MLGGARTHIGNLEDFSPILLNDEHNFFSSEGSTRVNIFEP